MGAMKDTAMLTEEALSAFLAEHPHVDADAIRKRWGRACLLALSGAVGPACPETGTRLVQAEGMLSLGTAKVGDFTTYRTDLTGRTCDCADYVYRLGRADFPGFCKHLLAVWFSLWLARTHPQPPVTAALPTPDAQALRTALEDACKWLENLHQQVGPVSMRATRPKTVTSIGDFYRLLNRVPPHPPAA